MAQIFHPSFNTLSKVSIFGAVFFLGAAVWAWDTVLRSPYATQVDVAREQPVPFSHKHHVQGLGIDCRFCHTAVEESALLRITLPQCTEFIDPLPQLLSLGLVIGVSLLLLRELSDRTFYSLRDLQSALELPVLGAIPVIRLPADLALARARVRRLVVAGVVILALIAGGTLAYVLVGDSLTVDEPAETARLVPPALELNHV